MSTSNVNAVTGRKTTSWKVIVGISAVVVIVVTVLVWHFVLRFKRPQNPSQPISTMASGGIEPTMQSIQTGKSPEDIQRERSLAAWKASLQMSDEAQAARERTAKQPNSFERRGPERKAKDIPMAGDALVADVADAKINLLLGSSRGSEQGNPKTGSQHGEMFTGMKQVAGDVPYMSLFRRRMIALQQERQAKGESGAPPKPLESGPGPKMVPYDIPAETEPVVPPSIEESEDASARMPVNVLPPYTIPIPCTFDVNFVAAGAGEDTKQRIICNVEQDVWARNRLQLPRGAKIIGTSGGVRDLDLVDITFDTIQFPDLTAVSIKGQAYQPYTTEAPGNFGMRGVMGKYEEPDIPVQLAPIFIAALQGAAKSNLERLPPGSVRVDDASSFSNIAVQTTDRDRAFGAAASSLDKVVEMMLDKLKRFRPRVRIRAGSPVLIVLDDYVDLSKRHFMGHTDPLKQPPGEARAPARVGPIVDGNPALPPNETASTNPAVDRSSVLNALKNATPEQIKMLVEMAGKSGGASGTPTIPK